MKRFILQVVVCASLCVGCSTEDDRTAAQEQPKQKALEIRGSSFSEEMNYQKLMEGFIYDEKSSLAANLLRFEQYVHGLNPAERWELDHHALDQLQNARADVVFRFNYSAATQQLLLFDLLTESKPIDIEALSKSNINAFEQQLLLDCWGIFSNGDDDDNGSGENWGNLKIIGYAYGTQASVWRGYLYAGAKQLCPTLKLR